jgi:ankyrin repeat protein
LQLSISSNAKDINDDERLPEYRVAQANDQKHDLNLSSSEEIPGDACLNEENRLIYSETLEASPICRLSSAQDNSSVDPSASTTTEINNGVIPPGPVNASDQETSLLAEEVQSDDKIPNETGASETIPEVPVKDRSSITQMPEGDSEVPKLIREVIRGSLQKVTELLDSGHEPDCRHPSNDRTGVIFAAMLSHHNILALLLDRGASISAKDKQKRTALHYAASEGCK